MATIVDTNEAGFFYDRIARFYEWTFKVNRYRQSIANYFAANPLPLSHGARILDAGCGTGLLTLTMLDVLTRPAQVVALDLSAASLHYAQKYVEAEPFELRRRHQIEFMQGNLLNLPFPDNSFDFIVTCGALEYVPLGEGMSELARVLEPGGYLLHLPIRPTPMSRLFEVLFRFKTHSPQSIASETKRHFRMIDEHRFPLLDPINWTKQLYLAQKS